MGGTTSQQTSTTNSAPWDAQQPYIKQGFDAAQKIYNQPGPGYYPGSTVAPLSANQNTAFSTGANYAANNGGLNDAMAQNNNIIAGNYGDNVFKNIQSHVMPAVNSQFEGAGRFGSDSHAAALGTALTDAYAPFASSNMNAALDRAGTYSGLGWNNINNLANIGSQQQHQGQLETNDALARYNYNSQLPQLKLNQFMQNIGGNWGGTTTATQPIYQPGLGQQLLGATLGLGGILG